MRDLAVVYSRAQLGVEAPLVTVEVHIARGLPTFGIVGLPETVVKESRDRVRCAILNARYDFPSARITVNLAPAELPKTGGRFDLAIAVGILAAEGHVPVAELARYEFLGELALTGELRRTGGSLPAALRARDAGRALFVPSGDAGEASLARGGRVFAVQHLNELTGHLAGGGPECAQAQGCFEPRRRAPLEIADVKGQARAKRAMEIAAAGRHSALLVGPPGTGKTMLATRFPALLPPMCEAQALETAAVYSVSAAGFDPGRWGERPFRAPHHTASGVALVGGSSNPRPGEISLAHNGVLFLDELPEFERRVLEVLREPLESGRIVISRAARQAEFPARFQLLCAMNPCPCGHLGDGTDRCECPPELVRRYRARVSGPLLDRLDLQVETTPTREDVANESPAGDRRANDTTRQVAERVRWARERQLARQGKSNAGLEPAEIGARCALTPEDEARMDAAVQKLGLSARGRDRSLRVARTIADLAGRVSIETGHVMEALSYRQLERYAAS